MGGVLPLCGRDGGAELREVKLRRLVVTWDVQRSFCVDCDFLRLGLLLLLVILCVRMVALF